MPSQTQTPHWADRMAGYGMAIGRLGSSSIGLLTSADLAANRRLESGSTSQSAPKGLVSEFLVESQYPLFTLNLQHVVAVQATDYAIGGCDLNHSRSRLIRPDGPESLV
jgi:hypothetical protein